jgi:MFS family permease
MGEHSGVCYTIYFVNFFLYVANALVAPFYPKVAQDKNLSPFVIGCIFSAFPMGSFICSFTFGKMMTKWGRKRLMTAGLLLAGIAIFSFGLLDFIEDYWTFVILSSVTRLIQGIGAVAFGSSAYAIMAMLFPNDLDLKIGLVETAAGMGLMFGPLIGAGLHHLGGYILPFTVMSALFLFIVPYLWIKMPQDKPYVKPAVTIHYSTLLKNKRVLMAWIIPVLAMSGETFLEPVLAPHVLTYGMTIEVAGALFTLGSLGYALTLPLVNKLSKTVDRRATLSAGLLLSALSLFIIGPSPLLPNDVAFIFIGLALQGMALAICLIPCLPEMLEAAKLLYPSSKEELSDRMAGLLSASFAVGMLVGPPLGGFLVQNYGFAEGSSVYGASQFSYMILYLTIGGGLKVFRNCRKTESDAYKNMMDDTSRLQEKLSAASTTDSDIGRSSIEISDYKKLYEINGITDPSTINLEAMRASINS